LSCEGKSFTDEQSDGVPLDPVLLLFFNPLRGTTTEDFSNFEKAGNILDVKSILGILAFLSIVVLNEFGT